MAETWQNIGLRHATDKAFGHFYMDDYQRLLEGHEINRMLEIGIQQGNSIRMWEEIFPNSFVLGVDIEPYCINNGKNVMIGDATDDSFISRVAELGPFDLIVDDGSHFIEDVVKSYSLLEGSCQGLYVIEDLHINDLAVKKFVNRIKANWLPSPSGYGEGMIFKWLN